MLGENEVLHDFSPNQVIVDGFASMKFVLVCESQEELEEKYGQFAHNTWKNRRLCLAKIEAIRSDLIGENRLEELRWALTNKLDVLALSKEELTPTRVEPFKIEIVSHEPSYEKPLRYNQKLISSSIRR